MYFCIPEFISCRPRYPSIWGIEPDFYFEIAVGILQRCSPVQWLHKEPSCCSQYGIGALPLVKKPYMPSHGIIRGQRAVSGAL
jgi:hypothetical protein